MLLQMLQQELLSNRQEEVMSLGIQVRIVVGTLEVSLSERGIAGVDDGLRRIEHRDVVTLAHMLNCLNDRFKALPDLRFAAPPRRHP